jgi:glycosidase
MRARTATLFLAVLASAVIPGAACSSGPDEGGPPHRTCEQVVWYRPASSRAQVEIVGSWNGWKRPGTILEANRDDGWRVTGLDLPPGEHRYAIVDDGRWLVDPYVPTTDLHDGQEVTWVQVDDCTSPELRVTEVTPGSGAAARATLELLAGRSRSPLDPTSVSLWRRDGTGIRASYDAFPDTGKIQLSIREPLPPGKHVLFVGARDQEGHEARPARLTLWVEDHAFDWRDAAVYQVMVDRFRDGNGAALATPDPASDFAGGRVEGVRRALGDIQAMGFNAVWLSPLYKNPDGLFPGGSRSYSGYHGYWPVRSRELDPRFATEEELDRFVAEAHARGMRVIFDVVPHHVHEQHPYVSEKGKSWFVYDANGCSCGAASCDWAGHIQTCWFAPYLPTLDWRNPDVARQATEDLAWWLDRWDGDGVRIDAVPMMPRLASRRIAWVVRTRFDHVGVRNLVLGENFTGPGGYDLLRYQLGPQGLDSQFHFPLMWAIRRSLADGTAPLSDVDAAVRTGEEAWKGSGAVMGLIVGNHDVARFASASAGDANQDPWVPSPQPTDARVYAKQRVALALVFTLPGAPVVYYGDEIGLAGRNDPDSRRPLPAESAWTDDMRSVRALVTKVGKVRACSGALRRGTNRPLVANAELLAFARESPDAAPAVVVVTRSAGNVDVPLAGLPQGAWVDALGSGARVEAGAGAVRMALGAHTVLVLVPDGSTCAK